MKPSVLAISSLIYILGFLFLYSSNPDIFDKQDNIMFFVAGVSALIVYHIVFTLYHI
jgi:hypothetical protein